MSKILSVFRRAGLVEILTNCRLPHGKTVADMILPVRRKGSSIRTQLTGNTDAGIFNTELVIGQGESVMDVILARAGLRNSDRWISDSLA